MGRSLPPATQLILEQIAEMEPLYGALRRSDQLVLDQFFDSVQQHRAAIANAANLLPLEATFVLMLLEERKRHEHIHNELCNQLQQLQREIKLLTDPGP